MIEARFRPLKEWRGKKTLSRKSSPFSSSYGQTLDLLEQELRHLKAKDIVIECAFELKQIRNDGWPYSSANPSSPEVIVSFESPKGSLRIPCDKFTHYLANLRAIALSLEALRKVDRYGITVGGEQYRGWAQLPPGQSWRETLGINGEAVTVELINQKFRELAKLLHPDVGGNDSSMALLVEARDRGMKEIQ